MISTNTYNDKLTYNIDKENFVKLKNYFSIVWYQDRTNISTALLQNMKCI